MRFRTRIALVVVVAFVALTVLTHGVRQLVILPRFAKLEREEARHNIERCQQAISRELAEVAMTALDYSWWDDTYDFMVTRDPEYLETNFGVEFSMNLRNDLAMIVDSSGKIVSQLCTDVRTGEESATKDFVESTIADVIGGALLIDMEAGQASGVVMTQRGMMLVGGGQIHTSEGEGEARGAVIFGRLVTEEFIAALGEQARTDFQAWSVDDDNMPALARDALAELSSGQTCHLTVTEDGRLETFSVINGLDGSPTIILGARTERDITAEGIAAVRYSLVCTAIVSVLLLVGVLVLASKWISSPLSDLTESVKSLLAGEDRSKGVSIKAGGEVGVLADEFNHLLNSLDEFHREMSDVNDRLAGEVANHEQTEEELRKTMADLERFNKLAIGRENRMVELKREVNDFADMAGVASPYDMAALSPGWRAAGENKGQEQGEATGGPTGT